MTINLFYVYVCAIASIMFYNLMIINF